MEKIYQYIYREEGNLREFYAVLCKNEGWSVRALRERKKSMLYERTDISKRSAESIRNDNRLLEEKDMMTVDMFYGDLCILDFLGLQDTYSKKDLENEILTELDKFILVMGTDVVFMTRQKKVTIDGKDYKIDYSGFGIILNSGSITKVSLNSQLSDTFYIIKSKNS